MHELLVGVDEAGRGAVIGPMVIGFIAVPKDDLEKLKELGVKDSKKLTPKRRKEIFQRLVELFDRDVLIVSPQEIDSRSLVSSSFDEFELLKILNGLKSFLEKIIEKYLNDLLKIKVYVDAPGSYSTPERIEQARLRFRSKLFALEKGRNVIIDVHMEPKADEKYLVVSAASIIAKVVRDEKIEELKREIKEDFGSGYPSDPKTIGFLERLDEFPEYVRHTRSTVKRIKQGKKSFLERLSDDERSDR